MQKTHLLPLSLILGVVFFLGGLSYLLIMEFPLRSSDHSDLEWDYLMFSQVWPVSDCIEHQEKKHNDRACILYPNVTGWTVHGIWPTKSYTRGPAYCDRSWEFDPEKIQSIKPELMEYWPNVFRDTPFYSFWEHEWEKHGTCAAQLEALNSEFAYFKKGLDMVMKYNVSKVLEERGIVPSSECKYSIEEINEALIDGLDTEPIINCIYTEDHHLLSQVKVCTTPSFRLISCPSSHHSNRTTDTDQQTIRTNCPRENICYPATADLFISRK